MNNDKDKPSDGDKTITIIVNGRQREVTEKNQRYEDIVALAYPNPNFDNFLYTVIYMKGEDDKELDLIAGEHVNVKDGMILNVRRSDKS